MRPLVYVTDLGTKPYRESWQFQESLQKQLIAHKRNSDPGETTPPDGYLLFTEHPHVYTIGKSGNPDNLLFSDDILRQKGIEVIKTDRGGDITYHGPGQLVGYPVLDLEKFRLGIAKYIDKLEEVIIRTVAAFGITACRIPSRTGVWVNNNKLCAMGIKCSRYVSMHGFALNIRTDLDYFHGIIPCGIHEGGVTSFEQLHGHTPDTDQIRDRLVMEFKQQFNCRIEEKTTSLIASAGKLKE